MNGIIAKEFLCFYALLEMIISSTAASVHFTQTDLAELFGITLPIGKKTQVNNVKYSNNIIDCGANVCVEDINDFFCENSIPLRLSFIPSNYFDEVTFVDIIKNYGSAYMVFAICYGLLYSEPLNNDVGHVVLFENIDEEADRIGIYDPGPRNYGSKNVKIDDIVYAMKRRGGIFLFKKVDC